MIPDYRAAYKNETTFSVIRTKQFLKSHQIYSLKNQWRISFSITLNGIMYTKTVQLETETNNSINWIHIHYICIIN